MVSILPCRWPSRSIFVSVHLLTCLLTGSLQQASTIFNVAHSCFCLYVKDGMSSADSTSCVPPWPHYLTFIKAWPMKRLYEFGGKKKGEASMFYPLLSALSNISSTFCVTGLLMS